MKKEDQRQFTLSLPEERALIARAPSDPGAMETICRLYEPLVLRAAHQPHLSTLREDAESVARLALVKAVCDYDPSQNVPFAAFALRRVLGEVRPFFRQERRRWEHEFLPTETEDDETPSFWERTAVQPDSSEKVGLRELLTSAIRSLSPQERRVIHALLLDIPQKLIASRLGISSQAVGKYKKIAFQKLREFLKG